MNPRLRDLLFVLLGALSLLGGILLADVVVDDTSVSLPEPVTAFDVPSGGAAAADDPGAIVAPVLVAAPAPLFEDADVIPTPVYDAQGASEESSSEAGGGGSTGGLGDSPPPGGSPTPPSGSGSSAGNVMATIVRFIDFCADNPAGGCPNGIGATILFAGETPPPPPLQIEVLPEATTALFPSLRCDPGWPSEVAIPVALLSNRPFSLLHVQLRAADGTTVLDEEVNLKSPPSEHTLYDQQVKASKPTGATLAAGAHTCLTLHTDGRGQSTPSRAGEFELFVQGYAGSDYLAKTHRFDGQYSAERPPVRIIPRDANTGFVWVPQLRDDSTFVWLTQLGDATSAGCSQPTQGADQPLLNSSTYAPQPIAPLTLNSATYPWDRTYDYHTIWNLDVRSGAKYTLCVQWRKEGRTDEWLIETPDGVALAVSTSYPAWRDNQYRGPARIQVSGMPGCGMLTEDGFLRFECASTGTRLADDIEFVPLLSGSNDPYGFATVSRTHLIAQCGPGGSRDKPPCKIEFEWRNQRTLCGGGLYDPKCQGDLWLSYDLYLKIDPLNANQRPNPQDWGVFEITRLGEQSDTVPFP